LQIKNLQTKIILFCKKYRSVSVRMEKTQQPRPFKVGAVVFWVINR